MIITIIKKLVIDILFYNLNLLYFLLKRFLYIKKQYIINLYIINHYQKKISYLFFFF